MPLKPWLKNIIYQLRLAGWLNAFVFRLAQFRNRRPNQLFRQQYPGIVVPPDYMLYETYQLNYRAFIEDGALAASEIMEWTKPFMVPGSVRILDWGCGAGRIIRHLPVLAPAGLVYGCDSNEQMIEWDRTHYPGITFTPIHGFTPTPYAPGFFDMVCGISVFTHIAGERQEEWLRELHRILKEGGILLISTHGSYYAHKLLPAHRKILAHTGVYTQPYHRQGHRMMSTHNNAGHFMQMLAPYFTILASYEGLRYPAKLGGQDLWILRKK